MFCPRMRRNGTVKFARDCLFPLAPTASIASPVQESKKQGKHVSEKPVAERIYHAFEIKSACAATTFLPASVDGI